MVEQREPLGDRPTRRHRSRPFLRTRRTSWRREREGGGDRWPGGPGCCLRLPDPGVQYQEHEQHPILECTSFSPIRFRHGWLMGTLGRMSRPSRSLGSISSLSTRVTMRPPFRPVRKPSLSLGFFTLTITAFVPSLPLASFPRSMLNRCAFCRRPAKSCG